MCSAMYNVAKRKDQKEQTVFVPVGPSSPSRAYVDAPLGLSDDDCVMLSEEEMRAWSEFDRPETPSGSLTSRPYRLPKRYQGVFQERYILMILVLIVVLFIASTFQMDTKTELEEIKRMYNVDESIRPVPRSKARK